jgi:hypothetical protein
VLQIGGMQTIQEDSNCLPGPYGLHGTHMKLRNSSALGMYGHPSMALLQHGSADIYNPYNNPDGPFNTGFNNAGMSLSGGPPQAPPRASFNLFDSAAAAGGSLGPRVSLPSRPQSRHEVPPMTQTVALPPDDHSWSLTNTNANAPPPRPIPQHTMFHNPQSAYFGMFQNQQQQQPMPWGPQPMGHGITASLHNSPHSSDLSRQTPSPSVAPPGFIISSSEGPRQLLIKYTPLGHTDIAGAPAFLHLRSQRRASAAEEHTR